MAHAGARHGARRLRLRCSSWRLGSGTRSATLPDRTSATYRVTASGEVHGEVRSSSGSRFVQTAADDREFFTSGCRAGCRRAVRRTSGTSARTCRLLRPTGSDQYRSSRRRQRTVTTASESSRFGPLNPATTSSGVCGPSRPPATGRAIRRAWLTVCTAAACAGRHHCSEQRNFSPAAGSRRYADPVGLNRF